VHRGRLHRAAAKPVDESHRHGAYRDKRSGAARVADDLGKIELLQRRPDPSGGASTIV